MIDKKKMYYLSILNAFGASILIALALFTKFLIDAATNKNLEGVILFGCLLVVCIALQEGIKIASGVIKNKYNIEITLGLKRKIYANLLNKTIFEISSQHSGEYTNNFLHDIENVATGVTSAIPFLWGDISRFVCALISLAIIDWRLLLILIAFGLLMIIGARIYTKFAKKWHKASLEIGGKVNAYVQESIENAKIIKAMEAEKRSLKMMDQLLDKNKLIKRKLLMVGLVGSVGVSSALNIIYAFGIVYGASLIYLGVLTYGSFAAILQLISHIENPLANFSTVFNGIAVYRVSYVRLENIFKLENEEKSAVQLTDFDALVFDSVDFAYDNHVKVLENFSMKIKKGEIVLIKGESGIGKTTIFNLILGFNRQQKGEIYLEKDGKKYPLSAGNRNLFSYVPQENILFSGTIRENIMILSGEEDDSKIVEALKKTRIYDDLMKLEKGIDTELKERGQGLSLGQIQRILIAISLLNGKQVMLLDEFTSALDNTNERQIVQDLINLDKTLIIVSHRRLDIDNVRTIELERNK